MITYLYSSIFDSPAQTLVNTVNTVGVMGKGIAKTFKDRYPIMFKEYRTLCGTGKLTVGRLHLWTGENRWILNFPTKTTWRLPSTIDYVEQGLSTFQQNYEAMGITSVSFPPLGCGNGSLDWRDVKPLMERYLSNLSIPVYIHSLHVGPEFVAEQNVSRAPPQSFEAFEQDIRAALLEQKGEFSSPSSLDLSARMNPNGDLLVYSDGRLVREFSNDDLQQIWLTLRDGVVLSSDIFEANLASDLENLLFPILEGIPYIQRTWLSRFGEPNSTRVRALFLAKELDGRNAAVSTESAQACLPL